MSQNQTILSHLKRESVTSMQAFSLYGITRLAARISNLKDKDIAITTTLVTKNKKTFAEYTLTKNK